MPKLHEIASEMSSELLHADAFGQIVAERQAAEKRRREHRRKKIRQLFSSDLWLGALPLFVRKLMVPVEVKLVLSALGEEAQHLKDGSGALGASLGIDIITPRVVEDILRCRNEIRRDIYNGKMPRVVALWLMANVARDYATSGRFHVYRGRLSMQGSALRSVIVYCFDELTKVGQMSAEDKSAAIKATNEDIREMG